MKKVSKFLVAGISAFALAFTPIAVNAAPSPTVQGIVSPVVKESTDKAGNPIKVSVKEAASDDSFDNVPEEKREVYKEASKEIAKKEKIK